MFSSCVILPQSLGFAQRRGTVVALMRRTRVCTLRYSAGSIKGGTVVALMRHTRVCTLRYSRGLLLGTIRIPAHVGVSTPYYPLFSLRRPD